MENKKWQKSEIEELIKLFNKGKTKEQISQKLNRTKRAIESQLSNLGLLKSNKIWTDDEIKVLIDCCLNCFKISDILEKIPTKSKSQIKSKIFKLGIDYNSDYRLWTQEEIEQLSKLRKENKSVEQIAKILNRGIGAIEGKINIEKIHLSDEFTCTKLSEQEKSLIVLRLSDGLSCTKIATILNRNPETVRRFCRCNKINSKHGKFLEETKNLKKNGKRKCRRCLKISDESYFKNKRNKTYCDKCLAKTRKEKYIERNKKGYSLEKFIEAKLSQAKRTAKKQNLIFNLTMEDILNVYQNQNGKCFYTGIEMQLRRNDDFSLSIDKKDRRLGYTKDNIVLCCWVINFMKNKIPIDSFIILCELVSKNISNIPLDYQSIYNRPMTPFSKLTYLENKI